MLFVQVTDCFDLAIGFCFMLQVPIFCVFYRLMVEVEGGGWWWGWWFVVAGGVVVHDSRLGGGG